MSQRKKSKHEQKKKDSINQSCITNKTGVRPIYLSIQWGGGGVIDLITAPGQRYQRHGNQALPEGKLSNTVIIT